LRHGNQNKTLERQMEEKRPFLSDDDRLALNI
jgi:hypothetical protein